MAYAFPYCLRCSRATDWIDSSDFESNLLCGCVVVCVGKGGGFLLLCNDLVLQKQNKDTGLTCSSNAVANQGIVQHIYTLLKETKSQSAKSKFKVKVKSQSSKSKLKVIVRISTDSLDRRRSRLQRSMRELKSDFYICDVMIIPAYITMLHVI